MPAELDSMYSWARCGCSYCAGAASSPDGAGAEGGYYVPDPPKIPGFDTSFVPDPPVFPNGTPIPDPPVIVVGPRIPDPPGSDGTSGASSASAGTASDFTPLLKPFGEAWNGQNLGMPALVPYSFATRSIDRYSQDGTPARAGFDPENAEVLDAAQRASIERALSLWGSVSGLVFIEVPDPAELIAPGIRFLLEDLDSPETAAVTYSDLPLFADVIISREYYADDAMASGTYGFYILLHEIGHAVGFKHPFTGDVLLPLADDNTANTVMSYTDAGNYTGLGRLDFAAVRYLYGTQEAEATAPVRWERDADGSLVSIGDDQANLIVGLAIRDVVFANGGDDRIELGAGDDVATPGIGNDAVFGGAGTDVLDTRTLRLQATVAAGPDRGTVAAPDGTDSYYGVEILRFLDGDLALSAGGAAGQAYRLYGAVLGREPDAIGLGHWTAALQSGAVSLQDAAASFVGSAEFATRYGAVSDAGFVSRLYANVLGRAPDAAGMLNWVEAASAPGGRGGVLVGFAESAEYRGRTAAAFADGVWAADPEAVDVMRAYVGVLDRLPDAGGLAFWTAERNAGFLQHDLIGRFVSSAEFQDRFGGLSNGDFVERLYRTALDRAPDAEGAAAWTRVLDSGSDTRAGVALGFAGSFEMTAKVAPLVQDGILFA